jgi:hypothetical protein
MRLVFALAFISAYLPLCAFAQQAPPMADEDVIAMFNRISQRAGRLEPMLEQLHPNEWVAKGAPDTYVAQWNSLRQQYAAMQSDLADLSQHPDRLTDSMRALFRLQAANQALGSLMGGVRKYQNPALAELIESVAAESARDIDGFEQHLTEMADAKEQQLALVDKEAQRCRAMLSREPAKSSSDKAAATIRKAQ